MAIGDILELTHSMTQLSTGEKVMNRWYYAVVDILGNAAGLYNAWAGVPNMEGLVCNLIASEMKLDTIRVINLFSLTDFFEGPGLTDGRNAGGQMLPLHNAVNIALKLDTRGVRAGSKRIAGMTEVDQSNGAIVGTTYITDLNTLLTAIPQDVVEPGLGTYDPVVVKRILEPADPPDHPNEWYRLPANQGEANYGHINLAVANMRVSHQVSRGNGR